MRTASASALVLLACVALGAHATLYAQHAGETIELLNMDMNNLWYEYDLNVRFEEVIVERGCTITRPSAATGEGILVDLGKAFPAGCNNIGNIARVLNEFDTPYKVVLFTSIEKGDPASFETYGVNPIYTEKSPYKEDVFYTFIRQVDWKSELDASANFTGRITSNPSSLTVFSTTPMFLTTFTILGVLGIFVCVYALGMLIWLWRCRVTLLNFRGCLLLAFGYFGTVRWVSYGLDPYNTRGRLTYAGTDFLYWSGLFAAYLALNMLFTTWARTAITMSRQGLCGRKWLNLLTLSKVGSLLGIILFTALVIIQTIDSQFYSLTASMYPITGFAVIIAIMQCVVFIVAGARLLATSRGVSSATGGSRMTVSRKLSILLMIICFMFLMYIFVLAGWILSALAEPQRVFVFRWFADFVAYIIIFTMFGVLHIPGLSTSTHGSTGPSGQMGASGSVTLDEESGIKPQKTGSAKLNVVTVELKTKSSNGKTKNEEEEQIEDPSTPAQRELLALSSSGELRRNAPTPAGDDE